MSRVLLNVTLTAILFAGFSSRAVAQEQETPPLKEVFQTELVYPQEKGEFQFTWTSSFSKTSSSNSQRWMALCRNPEWLSVIPGRALRLRLQVSQPIRISQCGRRAHWRRGRVG